VCPAETIYIYISNAQEKITDHCKLKTSKSAWG